MEQKNFKKKILIISSEFYPDISENLFQGAKETLEKVKIPFDKKVIKGSLEIPFLLEKYKNNYLGYIILGCIIRGETEHYNVVKNISLEHIYRIAYSNLLPLSTALLTVENYSQAIERSDIKKKNLGGKAAISCIELIKKINEV